MDAPAPEPQPHDPKQKPGGGESPLLLGLVLSTISAIRAIRVLAGVRNKIAMRIAKLLGAGAARALNLCDRATGVLQHVGQTKEPAEEGGPIILGEINQAGLLNEAQLDQLTSAGAAFDGPGAIVAARKDSLNAGHDRP